MLNLLITILVAFSPTASAKEVVTFSFLAGGNAGSWEGSGLEEVTPTPQGLLIRSAKEGRITREVEFPRGMDTLSITYASEGSLTAQFRWHRRDAANSEMVVLPVDFEATDIPLTVDLNLRKFPQWDPRADRIALAFPAGTHVILRDITFTGYSFFDKLGFAWKSFWTFDDIRPYSINFLWGPMLVSNPVALEDLFLNFPPRAKSVNYVFYVILGIPLLVVIVLWCKHQGNLAKLRRPLTLFAAVLGTLWILYDLRMGLEIMSYLRDDYVTYHSQPLEKRQFRERGHFPTFAMAIEPLLRSSDRYIFLAEYAWPFLGVIRYMSYPSLPTSPNAGEDVSLWVIFERPDITVLEDGRLREDQNIISEPGEIIHEYAPGTFLFQTNPQLPNSLTP